MLDHNDNLELKILGLVKKAKNSTATLLDYRDMESLIAQQVGSKQKTIIHYLAEYGCAEALEKLNFRALALGVYEVLDSSGCTPLHLACEKLQYPTIQFLISVTDSLIAENKSAMQPLMYLQQEQDKIFREFGVDSQFFEKIFNEKQGDLSRGVDSLSPETLFIVKNTVSKAKQQPELWTKLLKVKDAIEDLTNAIHDKYDHDGNAAVISEHGKTTIQLLSDFRQSGKPGFCLGVTSDTYKNGVPFVGDKTESLAFRKVFLAEFEEFLPIYKNGSKEHTLLAKLSEIPIDNWIEAASTIIKNFEHRKNKLHLVYDEGFLGLIQKMKSELNKYSSRLAIIEDTGEDKTIPISIQPLKL